MPSNIHVIQSNFAQTLVATVETLVALMPAFTTNAPSGQGVVLDATAVFVPGTAATAMTLRVRQGNGTAGTVVGQPIVIPVTAGVANVISSKVLDAFNLISTLAYSLTLQATAATGNTSVSNALISAQDANVYE